ncbi:MAG: PAS domain S-box protein [Burkholderiales bacterium]|nr:PAS domain S-box protein [Burkholderiales bacterium]
MRRRLPDADKALPRQDRGEKPGGADTDTDTDADTEAAAAPLTAALVAGARRRFFRVGAALSIAGSPLPLLLPPGPVGAGWLVSAFLLLGVASALALRAPAQRQPDALTTFVALDSIALAVAASNYRTSAGDVPLALFGVLACVAFVGAGRRAGVRAAALQLALLVALHALWWPGVAAEVAGHLVRLALHAINIAAGTAAGLLVAGSLASHARNAAEREWRFRRLLALAADAYWETDGQHRLQTVTDAAQERGELIERQAQVLGREPWTLAGFACDAEVLRRLRADLDAHRPLRDVPMRWTGAPEPAATATPRHLLVSGAPRFDEAGRFAGYWGLVRDVTQVHAAELALRASESRYRELFALSPAPLVVHRGGDVIDANAAALALFGAASLDELRRTNLYDFFEPGEPRERAYQRRDAILKMPVGTVLPMADFRFLVGGRLLSVRAAGVCIEVAGQGAVLVIIADDTERLAAEAAVRRSETLLSHLVATTPDLVAVTELASGRFTMVNPAFERDLGWSAAEAVGRTSLELGTWWSPEDRPAFAQALLESGRVLHRAVAFRTRGGRRLDMSISAARFAMQGRDYMVISGRDLTAGERLRQEREAILANASVGIAVTRERQFVLANRLFEQMFGWGEGELLGQPGRVVWPDEATYAEIGQRHGPALGRGERVEFETTMARKDGSTLLALMRAHAIDPVQPRDGGTVWIAEDVTARREAERALREARSAAEAASRAKSAFLANTSHELRTPLNGIVGLAALARNPALDATLRQRYLEQIVDSARALAAIISDILDLSKIEAGRLELERTTFDLGELLRALQQTYAPLAATRGLALRFEVDESVRTGARGDPLRLRQVIGNFLSNALKFTPEGEIVVRARRRAGGPGAEPRERVRVEVHDTGLGIEPAARARLFRPFSQADESTTRRFGGTGLGLSISRELAALMGGEVGVTSEPGRGSCFWLELPLPEAVLPAPAPPPVSGSLAGMRVLLVEDNQVNMLIAVAMLEGWGIEVEQSADGAQAVQALQRALAAGRLPDVVLMDVQMPQMSGYEATRALRALPGLERLPIVALTAAAMVDERERSRAAGMDDFLTKPIDPDRLRAALLRWRPARATADLPGDAA